LYNIPPHLKRVDTLPWEILTPERHKQPEVYNVIYDISQGIVAMEFRPAETSMTLLQIYCLVCFERIFKIAQHEAKLQERKLTA